MRWHYRVLVLQNRRIHSINPDSQIKTFLYLKNLIEKPCKHVTWLFKEDNETKVLAIRTCFEQLITLRKKFIRGIPVDTGIGD